MGATLERASGRYLDDILTEKLWRYLGIDAAFESGNVQQTNKLAALYYYGGSLSRSPETQKGILRPANPGDIGTYFAAGLTISAPELAKVAALLANDGCYDGVRFVSAQSVKTMETYNEQRTSGGFYQVLPLRYQTEIYGRESLYYHTGSAYGVSGCFSYDPATRDGVVVLSVGAGSDQDGYGVYAVCGEINNYIYNTLQGYASPKPDPETESVPPEPTVATLTVCGDVMSHQSVLEDAWDASTGSYDYY